MTSLHHSLFSDPRVTAAKKLLLAAVADHTTSITGPCPGDPARRADYDALISRFGEQRSGNLWYPYLGSGVGKGALVALADGSVKYDMISGIGAHFGHNHPDIMSACVDAAISNTVMQGNLQQNIDSTELCQLLLDASGLDHCFFSTSGAMACENGWKIILQKRHPASRLLAFERCFMGRTLAMSQITDKSAFREGLPLNIPVDYLPFYDASRPEESIRLTIETLKKHLHRYPGLHAGMAFELIQGEAGYFAGSREFFVAIMEILVKEGIAIFIDEVQSFGRTSRLFAFQHFGLEEYVDVVTVGKLLPACSTLFRHKWKPKGGLLSQTFTASTAAIKVSSAIIKSLVNEGYLGPEGKNMTIHRHFVAHLEQICQRHPELAKGPFGMGCMIGFTPYGGDSAKVATFLKELFHAGVIAFSAGSHPTRARFLVPIGSVTLADITGACVILEDTLVRCAHGAAL